MDQPLTSPALRALNDAFHAMLEKSRTEPAARWRYAATGWRGCAA